MGRSVELETVRGRYAALLGRVGITIETVLNVCMGIYIVQFSCHVHGSRIVHGRDFVLILVNRTAAHIFVFPSPRSLEVS